MKIFVAFILAGFFISPALSHADCARTYIFGFNGPAISKDKTSIEGLSGLMLEELKKRVGCVFDQKDMPTNRARDELRRHRIDIFGFAFVTPETKEFADTITVYSTKRILLVNKKFFKEGASVADYVNNPKIKFAIPSGGMRLHQEEELKILQKDNRVVFDPFPDGVLQLLYEEKVQATFITNTFMKIHEKKYPVKSKTEMITDGTTVDLALWLSKKRISKKEREAFQQAISEMQQDGTIRRILLKYTTAKEIETYYKF
jgi:polar amino acid transport system substrate-binding protein